jgi:hypothetical protein
MEKVEIKFTLEPTWFNNAPNIKVAINNEILIDTQLEEKLDFKQTVELSEDGSHQLTFTLYDKTNDDTEILEDGSIKQDTLIKMSKIEFEGEDITSMLSLNKESFYYEHDTNGSAQLEKHTLYDTLGCNGTATINFTTPFYVWLLENL